MCAEYNLKTSERDLSLLLDISILNLSENGDWDQHIRLFDEAPVLLRRDERVVLQPMHFSLLPPGGRVPFTANARLDDWDERQDRLTFVYERPTWRDSFLGRRCVIPVTEFLEPVYAGPHAGQMMGFFDPDSPLIFIAGFYKETVNVETGEVFSGFSMLTDFAHPFVAQIGHHRTVLTLPAEAARHWIEDRTMDGQAAVQFLLRFKGALNLDARAVRTMKGWKARVAANESKRASEERIRPQVEEARRRVGLV